MSYLHFNTDHGRETQARLKQTEATITAELATLSSAIDALVGNGWQAPGAAQFAGIMTEWQNSLRSAQETLAAIAARLNAEIAEWEETAAVFWGGALSSGIVVNGQMFFEPVDGTVVNSPGRMPEQPSFEPEEAAKEAVSSGISAEKVSDNTSSIAVGTFPVNHNANALNCVTFVTDQGRSVPAGNPATWIPEKVPKDGIYKGFYVGTQPRPGAIMAEAPNSDVGIGGTGHTSIVEQVNKDGSYRVVEGNWDKGKIHEATFQADGTSGKRRSGIFIYGPVEPGSKK